MERKYYKSKTVMLNDPTYNNGIFNLDYYLLITDLKYGIGRFKKIYGIEIVKNYIDNLGNNISQSSDVKSITFDEHEIYNLLDKIIDGTVTPISLKDIVEDYLKQKDLANQKEITKGA